MRKFAPFLTVLALVTTSAGGAEKFDPAARAAAIAPFIDEQTLVIVRIDMTRIDPAAIAKQVLAYAKSSGLADKDPKQFEKAIAGPQKIATEWIEAFRKAGGKDIYMVFSLAYNIREPFFWVVPLGEGANAKAISALLVSGKADGPASRPGTHQRSFFPRARTSATLHKAVCAAPASTLEALRRLRPHARPNLAKAFAAAGDTAVQALVLPTDDTRRVIEETLPQLPKEVGGGPSTAITRGLLWAAAGVSAPPKLSLTVTIQSQDAGAAKALRGVIQNTFKTLGKQRDVRKVLPTFDKLAAALTPQAAGDKLRLRLSGKQLDALISESLSPAVVHARRQAKRTASASHISSILKAVSMYIVENKGQFPPDLSALKSYFDPAWKMLANPSRPELEVGYVYVRPAVKVSDLKDPADAIILYEAHERWGEGINVGFADGHVQFIADQARFKKLLKKGK